ncbi:MAG: succinate dehydrogenase cytochrome b subunit [Prevotellaceae bacterium]|jgi:succinate dehydrogenase / fumarate reductase cytochrome b subunit|nr:succinate dehydrogenase cytochrome b subunit [Prevotellaceae bacterium]
MWLLNSSIGKKLIMSISGVFLILFLLFHMSMNIVAVFSADAYNMICELLGANWYALVGTAVLAGGFLVHIVFAFMLTLQNQKARGNQSYAVSERPKGVDFASQNMFILGTIVVLGLIMHFAQFWYKMQFAEILGHHEVELGTAVVGVADGAAFIKYWFSNPIICILYLIWFAALWFHLTHGFWSAIQTIGWSNQIWYNRWKCISNIFATVVFLGFALVVVTFFLKSLCA